jgi:hypothetical protein
MTIFIATHPQSENPTTGEKTFVPYKPPEGVKMFRAPRQLRMDLLGDGTIIAPMNIYKLDFTAKPKMNNFWIGPAPKKIADLYPNDEMDDETQTKLNLFMCELWSESQKIDDLGNMGNLGFFWYVPRNEYPILHYPTQKTDALKWNPLTLKHVNRLRMLWLARDLLPQV